jgi:energy-coupling factor transporter ATP-binding protein EcfA2
MTIEGAAALKTAKAAIDLIILAEKQGWLDRLTTALRKKHKVLILGSTGVGKTNFLESLTDLVPKAIEQMNRTEFAEKHSIKIAKQPFIFVDTPGQIEHQSRRIAAIRDAMRGDIAGVINVVSYGYHEWRIGQKSVFDASSAVREEFLKQHREKELESLREWTTLLGGRETVGWLITVVTKADLWWHRQDEVFDYYRSGAYYAALGEAQSLRPVVLEYCSVFHKFYGTGLLSGTFDEADRVRARAHLLRQLLAAVGAK